MSEHKQYDAIVIGAGKAGTPLAQDLAGNGLKTALVDGRFSGGAPLEERAISKSYAVCSRYAGILRRAVKFGFPNYGEDPVANWEQLKNRAGDLSAASVNESSLSLFHMANLEPIGGFASFLNGQTVLVIETGGESYRISAPKIFISTGTRNSLPDIKGLDGVGYFSAETLWRLEQIPEHLIVVGGGYIGVETAQQFSRFGSKVTLLQRNRRLLPREDPDFSDAVNSLLRNDEVDIRTGVAAVEVSRPPLNDLTKPDPLHVTLEGDGLRDPVVGTHLFLAAGRAPNTNTLNLSAAGIETDSRGYIQVNDLLETSVEGIWAMGDVTGSPSFANLSYDDYQIVSENLFGKGGKSRKGRLFSTTLRTDPSLAGVGLRESDLKGDEPYRIIKKEIGKLQYAKDAGEVSGLAKAVIEENTGRLLGFEMIGPSAAELAGAAHLAIMGRLTAEDLRSGLFTLPGAMEVFNELFTL